MSMQFKLTLFAETCELFIAVLLFCQRKVINKTAFFQWENLKFVFKFINASDSACMALIEHFNGEITTPNWRIN